MRKWDQVNSGQLIIAIDNQTARSSAVAANSNYQAARINYEKYAMLYNERLVTELSTCKQNKL